jgi:hypothetical protein
MRLPLIIYPADSGVSSGAVVLGIDSGSATVRFLPWSFAM